MPRWPYKPERNDPDFRRFSDRVNFAFHVVTYGFFVSGLWFVNLLYRFGWEWMPNLSLIWTGLVLIHGTYTIFIAKYPGAKGITIIKSKKP